MSKDKKIVVVKTTKAENKKEEPKNAMPFIIGCVMICLVLLFGMNKIDVVYVGNLPIEENGGIPVNIQDQTTRPFDIRLNQILNDTSYGLSVVPVIDEYTFTLNTTANLSVGDNIALLEQNGMPQLYFGVIQSININTITLDAPMPYNFTPSATVVFEFNNNMVVDGSTNTEIFSIVNFFDEAIDITRVIWHCTDTTSMDDAKFCGDSELDRGFVFRKKLLDGTYINYFNIKTNGGWAELAFDKSYDDKAPAGFFGFTTRLTWGGQSKHGVIIRLQPGESIEGLVQDDYTGFPSVSLMVEGHFVQN